MTKKLTLLSAAAVAALIVACTAGVTIAVVTTDNSSSGSLTTANLNLSAKAENLKVFTAVPASAGDEGVFEDENGALYKYEQSVAQGVENIPFGHGGTVSYNDKSVTIDGILPGDKVEFDIAVTSTSTISFNYRAELYVDATEGETLLNQLEFQAGTLGLLRQDITDPATAKNEELSNAVLTDYTEWTSYSGNQASIETVHITVALPITADEGQGEKVKLYYVVNGVQNTEQQRAVAEIIDGDSVNHFYSLSDAVGYAERHAITNISVIGDTLLEEGEVNISRALRFTGKPDENGNYPTVKGARISISEAAAATFENIAFEGNGYINVSDATALTLRNCKINTNPVKFFDTASRDFLPDPAFIVAGDSLTAVRLTITGNSFISKAGAVVCMRSQLRDGSEFAGNKFGSAENPYNGGALVAFGGAETDATVTLADNIFYGNSPLSLGNGAAGRFTVISKQNRAYGVKNSVFAGGTASAAFLDSGSLIEDNALTLGNISCDTLLFGGVDITLDDIQKISAGKICLSDGIKLGDFRVNFVTGGTLATNAIALYKDGSLYGYLKSSGADYSVEEIS